MFLTNVCNNTVSTTDLVQGRPQPAELPATAVAEGGTERDSALSQHGGLLRPRHQEPQAWAQAARVHRCRDTAQG